MSEEKSYIIDVDEDGNCILPDELVEALGWQVDDVIEYTITGEKTISAVNVTAKARQENASILEIVSEDGSADA